MSKPPSPLFSARGTTAEIENGFSFAPKFDAQGLMGAIATDAKTGEVLMFAWMNSEALARTLETREAHFWSRSRKRLWKKGEESGNILRLVEVRVDCDQDALWLMVEPEGRGEACHTGARTCFYRRLDLEGWKRGEPVTLERIEGARQAL